MGSRLKVELSYGSEMGPDCDIRYGFAVCCVSQHFLRILACGFAGFRFQGNGWP